MPSGYRINPELHEELGFLPLLAAAPAVLGTAGKIGGGIIKGIGSIFGGKKKKKPAAPPPPPAAAAAKSASSSGGSPTKTRSTQLSAGLAAGPSKDVKAEALAALKTYQQGNKAAEQSHAELVKKLAAVVKPSADKMLAEVKQAALQKKVTNEHNRKVREEERWKANELAHQQIMAKFDALEASLRGSHEATKRVFKIYGVHA